MDHQRSRDALRSFLIGTLLGDCHASSVYQWQWSNTSLDWVEWKAAYIRKRMGFSCNVHRTEDNSCKSGYMYGFTAASNKGRLRVYRNWFYDKTNVKRITKKIQHLDHPLGLTALILDQGSCRGGLDKNHKTGNFYYRKPTVRIHLNKHSLDELVLFQDALKQNFDLRTSIQIKNKVTGYPDLYFGTKATQDLWVLIKPTVPDIPFANKKFHPLISQTTNAKFVKRSRGVNIV